MRGFFFGQAFPKLALKVVIARYEAIQSISIYSKIIYYQSNFPKPDGLTLFIKGVAKVLF
jgi:hypothetical protein